MDHANGLKLEKFFIHWKAWSRTTKLTALPGAKTNRKYPSSMDSNQTLETPSIPAVDRAAPGSLSLAWHCVKCGCNAYTCKVAGKPGERRSAKCYTCGGVVIVEFRAPTKKSRHKRISPAKSKQTSIQLMKAIDGTLITKGISNSGGKPMRCKSTRKTHRANTRMKEESRMHEDDRHWLV